MALYTSNFKIMLCGLFPFAIPSIKFTSAVKTPIQSFKDEAGGHVDIDTDPTDDFTPSDRPSAKHKTKLFTVSLKGSSDDSINIFKAAYEYYTAPVTKFMFNLASYIAFLFLFSFYVMTNLWPIEQRTETGDAMEYLIYIWTGSLIVEEIRQILTKDPRSLRFKIVGWFANIWNKFDLLLYLLFLCAVIVRYTLPSSQFVYVRSMYCIVLAMFYLRFMQVFYAARNIGPKVIMIRKMLTDLSFFLVILIVFILAYGVSAQALLFPNTAASVELLKEVVYRPYWQMYGELFLETVEGEDTGTCTRNRTAYDLDNSVERCPEKNALVVILFVIYMIISNVLLLNLLIAMFSYTFQTVQDNSEKVWRYYRFSLVFEFYDRPAFPPPLIIISHFFRAIMWCVRICKAKPLNGDAFRLPIKDHQEYERIQSFEKLGMEGYLHCTQLEDAEKLDVKINSAGERIEEVIDELEDIKNQMEAPLQDAAAVSNLATAGQGQGDDAKPTPLVSARHDATDLELAFDAREELGFIHSRITSLDKYLDSQAEKLDELVKIMYAYTHRKEQKRRKKHLPEFEEVLGEDC